MSFLAQIAMKLFKLHPATEGSRTVATALVGLIGAIAALITCYANGDTNIKDYAEAGAAILGSLGVMFLRSGNAKTGAEITAAATKLEALIGNKPEEVK